MNPITKNTLFYGDSLKILREYIPDESADLIYLDPPFNSNRNYDALFKDESGQDSEAQITAFEDTWHWDRKAQETYHEVIADAAEQVGKMISALKDFIGANQVTAYLVMMTVRLMELHRVLKSAGSLYLHRDATMSHCLKIVLDTIFGKENFRNEIVWCYRKWNVRQPQFPSNHDILLFYTKTQKNFFHTLFLPKSPKSSGRDLIGTVNSENAQMGIFLTLNEATKDMKTAAAEAGFCHSDGWNRDYPGIQIMSIAQLMSRKTPDLPPVKRTFKGLYENNLLQTLRVWVEKIVQVVFLQTLSRQKRI